MIADIEHGGYEWKDAAPVYSHSYLVPAVLRILRARVAPPAAVIDAGCGNGQLAGVLAAQRYAVCGFDLSREAIETAGAAYPSLRFEVGSIYDDWPARLGPADAVVSLEVAEHLFYPKHLFARSHAALRDGGVLVASTPYHGYVKNIAISLLNGWDSHFDVTWDGGHIKFFSKRTFIAMARAAGFRNVHLHNVGRFPGLAKSMILVAEK